MEREWEWSIWLLIDIYVFAHYGASVEGVWARLLVPQALSRGGPPGEPTPEAHRYLGCKIQDIEDLQLGHKLSECIGNLSRTVLGLFLHNRHYRVEADLNQSCVFTIVLTSLTPLLFP